MKLTVILLVFSLLLCPFYSEAQMEAAVWPIDSGKQINFQSGNSQFIDFNGSLNVNATICDKNGKLLLMTDGDTIWNGNNEVLINGANLIEEGYVRDPSQKPVFVPYPGKEGSYLLIYACAHKVLKEILNYFTTYDPTEHWIEYTGEFYETFGDFKLVYAEIDINADGGHGKVISKQNFIQSNFGELSISGYCGNSYYWMAVAYDEPVLLHFNHVEKTRMLFYKIDENGISQTPEKAYFDYGDIGDLKFSPNGDKLYFSFNNLILGDVVGGVLHDFNFLTGEIYNYRDIGVKGYGNIIVEFSPNSHFLYIADNLSIRQIDARYTSEKNVRDTTSFQIIYSSAIILDENNFPVMPLEYFYTFLNLQLTPDGKIHVLHYCAEEKKYANGWIEYPNMKGKDCNLRIRTNFFENNKYSTPPNFVTSFFRDKSLDIIDEQYANAGPDKEVCFMSKIDIGLDSSIPYDIYQWYPEKYIKDPLSPQDTFMSPWVLDTTKYISTLRVTDGNCWLNFDDMEVTVFPRPPIPEISGSWSVCPFAEEVDYWVEDDVDQNQYFWRIEGGEITGDSDSTSNSIKVNWGDIYPEANVYATVISGLGCESKGDKDSVTINHELEPEVPKGYDYLCKAESYNVAYKTRYTNGSVYEWIVDGGIIIEGQGSNEIRVRWKHDGDNKIFVKEYSENAKNSCYGESEPLKVKVINDSTQIELSYLSFTTDNRLEVYFYADNLSLNNQTLIQHTENVNTGFMEDFYPLNSGLKDHYIYRRNPEETGSQIISLEVIGRCDEVFHTTQQQSIFLSGEIYPEQTTMSLQWNLNRFWEVDQIKHEIWHSEDGKTKWELIATLDRQTNYEFEYPDVSLNHYIRVKEINEDKNIESWSNTIDFQVSEILRIPDVFTPNGDGYNDTWEIWNIDDYIFKSLTVYSKKGDLIYKCKNGYIPWDGKIDGKVYQDTYFYEIKFERHNPCYGQVTVLQ